MAQDTALQVIELQQLPIIVERLHSVKADIERRTAEATSLICTEETYKSVKDVRAQLNKEFKEYEAQRTAIKSKILEPYKAFEQIYRECVTEPFQQADAELKQKITDVTSGIVAQKTESLMDYYGELVEVADIDWLDDLTYRPKVNMSDSLTSLKSRQRHSWTALWPTWPQSRAWTTPPRSWWSTAAIWIYLPPSRLWLTGTKRWRNSGGGKKSAAPGRQSGKPLPKKPAPQLWQLRRLTCPPRCRSRPNCRKPALSRNPSLNFSLPRRLSLF